MDCTASPVKGKDMMERTRTDRKQEYNPVDIVCPPDKYMFTSSFVSKALAFTVRRKIESLNSLTDSIISSTNGSIQQMYALRNLVTLIDEDPRLSHHLDSQVLPHLVHFLKHDDKAVYENDDESFKFQYYSAAVLSQIVNTNKGIKFKDEAVPLLLNLILSPARSVQVQVLDTLTHIGDAFPDSSDTMIKNGALELLESLLSDKWNHYLVLKGGAQLLTTFCKIKPPLPSDKIEIVIRTISTAIEYDYAPVLIQLCLALSILCDGGFVAVGTEVERLIDLICYQEPEIVISSLRIIGNYVRWGDDELIQYMFDQGLLLRLGRLLFHKHTSLRKETCWIMSNITAVANHSQLQRVINLSFVEILLSLVKNDEFEVKEYAACAISNVVSGSDRKHLESLRVECFKELEILRLDCHDDRVCTLCSEVLDKILYFTNSSECLFIREFFKSSLFLPKKVERSSNRIHLTTGSTANLASARPQGAQHNTRKKFIKGKKLFAGASSPNLAFDVMEDLDSKDDSEGSSTVTSLSGDNSINSSREKHSSLGSSKDSDSKMFNGGKKFKKGKDSSPKDSGSKKLNRGKKFKRGKDSASGKNSRKQKFESGKVASPYFSKRLHRRFGF